MKRTLIKVWTISLFVLGFILTQTSVTYAEEGVEYRKHYHHDFINEKDFKRLLDEGYSKKEIYKAAHIAKHSNTKIDSVLKVYKKNDSSWEKTAKHYGLDMEKLKKKCHEHKEKFLQEHKEEVIENIAEYTGKTETEIQSWMNEGVPLRFIFKGAVIAKVSNHDLADIIKMKKDGKSFKEIKESLNIDREKMRNEMMALMKKIKEDIKD